MLDMTNLYGLRKFKETWENIDLVTLRAYFGLLLLAGVYRSKGECMTELWDDKRGRPIFRATMSLKYFKYLNSCIRFDDKEDRLDRLARDKLAAIRNVFDKWNKNLRTMYVVGDNFFTSYELAKELKQRKMTIVGTIRKNRKEIPPILLDMKRKPQYHSEFVFDHNLRLTMVSYIPKKNRCVTLLSTLHTKKLLYDTQDPSSSRASGVLEKLPPANKRSRCHICTSKNNSNLYRSRCDMCKKYICAQHFFKICDKCT